VNISSSCESATPGSLEVSSPIVSEIPAGVTRGQSDRATCSASNPEELSSSQPESSPSLAILVGKPTEEGVLGDGICVTDRLDDVLVPSRASVCEGSVVPVVSLLLP
jgi:hypothetical protein